MGHTAEIRGVLPETLSNPTDFLHVRAIPVAAMLLDDALDLHTEEDTSVHGSTQTESFLVHLTEICAVLVALEVSAGLSVRGSAAYAASRTQFGRVEFRRWKPAIFRQG
jgi:hypothetical protein